MSDDLIAMLAAKLGTTTEYLWSVLIKQAPIAAVTDLLQYGVIALVVWLFARYVQKRMPHLQKAYGSEGEIIILCILGGGLLILIGVAFFSFPYTITAIVNPEYWALNRVLSTVRGK